MMERTFLNPATNKQWRIELDGHTIRTCLNGGKVKEILCDSAFQVKNKQCPAVFYACCSCNFSTLIIITHTKCCTFNIFPINAADSLCFVDNKTNFNVIKLRYNYFFMHARWVCLHTHPFTQIH